MSVANRNLVIQLQTSFCRYAIKFRVYNRPIKLTITEPRTYAAGFHLILRKNVLCSCGLWHPVVGDQADILLSLSLTLRVFRCVVCQWYTICSFLLPWHVRVVTSALPTVLQLRHVTICYLAT